MSMPATLGWPSGADSTHVNNGDENIPESPQLSEQEMRVQELLWEMDASAEVARNRAAVQKRRFRKFSYGAAILIGGLISIVASIQLLG